MSEIMFVADSAGEVSRNLAVDMEALILERRTWQWAESKRIEAMKQTLHDTRALRRAEVRIAEGLLLEAGPPVPETAVDEELTELPTGIFETIAQASPDRVRMDRIRTERHRRKEETKAERERREELEAEQRRQDAYRDARQRLRGRRSTPGPGRPEKR